MSTKVLVSGIKPTGRLHFGNYFGAMKQNIDLANAGEYMSYIFLADYHALTTVRNGDELRKQTLEAAASYIACGLDVSKAILFKQSDVQEVTELTWVFNNLVTMPYMMRAHAFKGHLSESFTSDNLNKLSPSGGRFSDLENINFNQIGLHNAVEVISRIIGDRINIGLLDYPVLMAADILMYGADIVPVGKDQKQHIEYARDIAGYYNRAYGVEQFKLPKDYILEAVATLPGIDGQKMSKSYNNHIELFCSDEELRKRVMSVVTDSKSPEEKKNPDENNIYNIHKHFLTQEEDALLRQKFEQGGYSYKDAKEDLLKTIMKWREGKKEKYDALMSNPSELITLLTEGGEKAKKVAQETMLAVRKQVGLGGY
jgi:tryptophanyl-tRNA synthetase